MSAARSDAGENQACPYSKDAEADHYNAETGADERCVCGEIAVMLAKLLARHSPATS
jgi:hypothetical protein